MTINQALYLKLEHCNNTNREEDAIMSYSSDNLSTGDINSMCVKKLEINSNNFPSILPHWIYDYKSYTPYVPKNTTPGSSMNVISPTKDITDKYYIMDLQITVRKNDNEWRNTYLYYPIERKYGPGSVSYDKNGYINERDMMNNRYFWANSSVLLQSINNALNRLSSDSNLMMVKVQSQWVLCQREAAIGTYTVYFCENMRRFLGFNYSFIDDGLLIDKNIATMTTLNKQNYYAISTIQTSNTLFPFKSINFTAVNLNVFELFMVDQDTPLGHVVSEATIESYSINTSDPDSVGDSISYISDSDSRALSLTSGETQPFYIKIWLVSRRTSQYYPLRLKSHEWCSVLLKFF